MSTTHEIRRTKLWLSAAAIFALGIFAPSESLAAKQRSACIAGCRTLKKDCIGQFKLQFTAAKANCKKIGGKADRKQCKHDLPPKKAEFEVGKQECVREFTENCKQCCKQDPMEDCSNTSFVVCGDGNTTGVEGCDDSNKNDGDGCSHVCQLEARCGDGTVDEDEECEADSQCLADETCVRCSCRPDCENDLDCPDDEDCVGGSCIPPLGTRTFSLGEDSTIMSSFLSSIRPGFSLGTPAGTIDLEAGVPDENGVATVTTPADGGPYLVKLDVDLKDLAQQFTICSKVVSCEGTLRCRGGANVDVEVQLDSLAESLTCEHVAKCHGVEPCCDNACEGAATNPPYTPENPWTPVTSGNVPLNRIGVNPGVDSGPGAMVLTCKVAALSAPLGTECATAAYEKTQDTVLTTGDNTARVVRHCPGTGAPAAIAPEFSMTGANFDCFQWAREDSAGALAFSIPIEEPSNLFTGDGAQAGVYDD